MPKTEPKKTLRNCTIERLQEIDSVEVREKLGLSQTELAVKLHVKPQTIRSWEQGWRNTPGPVLVLLSLMYYKKITL